MTSAVLQYVPAVSSVDASFWSQLAKNKLEVYKLSDAAVSFKLAYTNGKGDSAGRMLASSEFSFSDDKARIPPLYASFQGTLLNYNTYESFKSADKQAVFKDASTILLEDIVSGRALQDPSRLNHALLLTFADLKTHKYTYLFAFPAANPTGFAVNIHPYRSIQASAAASSSSSSSTPGFVPCSVEFSPQEQRGLLAAFKAFATSSPSSVSSDVSASPEDSTRVGEFRVADKGYFIVDVQPTSSDRASAPRAISIHPFSSLPHFIARDKAAATPSFFLAFLDPSGNASHPGWPLRNALYLSALAGASSVRVLSWRDVGQAATTHFPPTATNANANANATSSSSTSNSTTTSDSTPAGMSLASTVGLVTFSSTPATNIAEFGAALSSYPNKDDDCKVTSPSSPAAATAWSPAESLVKKAVEAARSTSTSFVGWERDERNVIAPRQIDLSGLLNPTKIMENSVDLNLKLMRWRMLPGLDVNVLHSTKALLVGSGTLGCNVARALLGWGFTHMTFVDSGKVSYSNPVRQTLFEFEDCVQGRYKAEAAAERVRKIYPGATTASAVLTVPMPGHALSSKEQLAQATKDANELARLVASHDVIFLLTDSRESRWYPTLLAQYYNKVCINAALGFDSYLVMRHGSRAGHARVVIGAGTTAGDSIATGTGTATATSDGSIGDACSVDLEKQAHLSCYFCADVTAPGNSRRDQTLDQQCTVTRPGLSFVASALAVEMLVAILHNKNGYGAPAFLNDNTAADQSSASKRKDAETKSISTSTSTSTSSSSSSSSSASSPKVEEDTVSGGLGALPHQIRGGFSTFAQTLMVGAQFKCCPACSSAVLLEYKKRGMNFVIDVRSG